MNFTVYIDPLARSCESADELLAGGSLPSSEVERWSH